MCFLHQLLVVLEDCVCRQSPGRHVHTMNKTVNTYVEWGIFCMQLLVTPVSAP
jgi:hypothetical protein